MPMALRVSRASSTSPCSAAPSTPAAEDYAPFNVDVTTENPGVDALRRSSSTDTAYGVRVVVSNTNWHDCACGGEAYTGEFSVRPEHDPIPAFVYTERHPGVEVRR